MKALAAVVMTLSLGLPAAASAASCTWPAWDSYKAAMMSADGRIIDRSSKKLITTSEGQSYGLFFALLANDKPSFERILDWTRNNLAAGDLQANLPAWLWGRSKAGKWQVLDSNNATDSDLWIAYTLLEAGRLWNEPAYSALGQNMLWRSAAQTVRKLPKLGLMMLPGDVGFDTPDGWRLNPSYTPPQLMARFAQLSPVWAELATNQQRLLVEGSPKGFAPDWLVWKAASGWAPDPQNGSAGDYDAIRVYLWVGMLADDAPGRQTLQQHFAPMVTLTQTLGYPPESVDAVTGKYTGKGPAGFSAALLPLLASADSPAYAVQNSVCSRSPLPPMRITTSHWPCLARVGMNSATASTNTDSYYRPGLTHANNKNMGIFAQWPVHRRHGATHQRSGPAAMVAGTSAHRRSHVPRRLGT